MLKDRGPYRRAALKSYLSQMSTPNPKVVFDDHVAEILEQQGFSWEEDPRSVYEPQQLYDALQRYATDWRCFEKFDKHLEFGFRMAYKIFAKPKASECLSLLSDSEVVSKALKLSKSSGLPLMTKKADALTYAFDRDLQIRKGIKAPNPCVAYKRTQRGNKTRLVWGYPLEMTIMEARFARPLIDRFLIMATPMAFGMSKLELGAKLSAYFEDKPGETICMDYSKYDSTVSAKMINRAFGCLATWFKEEDRERLGWDTVVNYFVRTPIVMPDGHLYTGKTHGVPSGSYFTQMIDSIINVALAYAMKSRFGLTFKQRQLYVLGDDVILQTTNSFNLREIASYLAQFGLVLHDDEKTRVGEVHFLGAVWTKGKPDTPTEELVRKAIFPENFRVYGERPHAGAEDVLRSYACNYLSGFKLVPSDMPWNVYRDDKPDLGRGKINSKWLSGSEKFLLEEMKLLRRQNLHEASLSLRFLL